MVWGLCVEYYCCNKDYNDEVFRNIVAIFSVSVLIYEREIFNDVHICFQYDQRYRKKQIMIIK